MSRGHNGVVKKEDQAWVIVLLLSCLMNKNLPFDVRLARAFLFLRFSGRAASGAPLRPKKISYQP